MCLLVMYCVLTTSSVEHMCLFTFEIEENMLLHLSLMGKHSKSRMFSFYQL